MGVYEIVEDSELDPLVLPSDHTEYQSILY